MSMWIETKRKFATLPMYKKMSFEDVAPNGYKKVDVYQNIGYLVKKGFLKRCEDGLFIKINELPTDYINKESCRTEAYKKKLRKIVTDNQKVHEVFDLCGFGDIKWLLSDVY